jgi:hypothetical protein
MIATFYDPSVSLHLGLALFAFTGLWCGVASLWNNISELTARLPRGR